MAETDTAPESTSSSPPGGSGGFDEESWVESRLAGETPEEVPTPAAEEHPRRQAAAQASQEAQEPAEGEEQAQQPVQAQVAPDVASALAEARLRPVEGETTEQALRRLWRHNEGRARSHHGDVKTLKDELVGVKNMVQPLWQALQQQAEAQRREEMLRQVPDKEADPQAYQNWLMEQWMLRQEQERQEAEQLAAQDAQQESLLTQDETALVDLQQGLSTEPEVRDGYSFALQVGMRSAEQQYPDASPEQLEELAKLSQQLMMRGLVRQGKSVSAYYRHMYAAAREVMGVGNGHATPQQQAAAATAVAQAQAAPPAQAVPRAQAPPAAKGSPTAARLKAESAAAAARAVVSPGPAASSPPTGEGIDLRQLDDEQAFELYQEFAKDGRADQWDRMVQEQFGVARR